MSGGPSPGGPLAGVRVLELVGLGAAPFGGMLLADLGAEVTLVDRVPAAEAGEREVFDLCLRGRRSVAVDLKAPGGPEVYRRLVTQADVLIDPYRPRAMRRLGLSAEQCLRWNRRLIYCHMTGWGASGPLAARPGHDLNYIAQSGALYPIGEATAPPPPPLNYVGDYGGGGMLMAVGVLAALLERQSSGRGQVLDVAMLDGAALQSIFVHGQMALGAWQPTRGSNLVDGGAPFYCTYATADRQFMAVACIEDAFYQRFLTRMQLDPEDWPQHDRPSWPRLKRVLGERFARHPRAHWEREFADAGDACVTPVLPPWEAATHPHNQQRMTHVVVDGVRQPASAPRFSRSSGAGPGSVPKPGEHTDVVLRELGYRAEEVSALVAAGAVAAGRPGGERPPHQTAHSGQRPRERDGEQG